MEHSNKLDKKTMGNDEKSVIELIFLFYKKRYFIYYTTCIAFIISLFAAFTTPLEFTSKARLLAENTSSNTATISSLAGLAGINLPLQTNANTTTIDPGMYPSILENSLFLSDLINEKFYIQEYARDIRLLEYLNGYKRENIISKGISFIIDIPNYISGLFKPKPDRGLKLTSVYIHRGIKIITPSPQEQSVISQMKTRIKVSFKDRFIDISVKMPEARLSAEVNKVMTKKLIDYIVSYKIAKKKSDLKFIEQRTEDARRKFVNAQSALAGFQDSNFGLIFQRGKARQDQLQTQYNLYFGIYNNLAGKLEQSRIDLKENTPLFSEFEPVTVPASPSSSNPFKIIIFSTFSGFFAGIFIVGLLLLIQYFKKTFKSLQLKDIKQLN